MVALVRYVFGGLGNGKGGKGTGLRVRTDVGGDAGKDDLAFVLGLDGCFEVGVVPGVYFAVSLDERCVGVEA